jgi:hypothetical protein
MVDGILRNSKTLVKKGPKKDTKKFQFRSGFVKNQHGSFVEGTMWSKSFDCTPLKKTSGGSMGSLEIVISIARTEDEPTHTSADPNVFGRGAQAEEYDGMIPRQNISFARLGEQLTTYSLTKLKHRGIERRPGVEVWRRVKFLYRTEGVFLPCRWMILAHVLFSAGIKSAGLDPISVIIRRFVLPPYVALRKEPDPDEPRQRLAKPDEKEKPKSDPEAGGKNNVDMEGVSALLGSSITRQLTSETNAFTTSFATQVRKVNVEQSDNSAPVSTAQDAGPAASSGTALTPILRILPQAVPPAQLSTNLAVNTPAMTDIQNDSFVQGTATPSHVPSSYGSASAGVEHEARVASTTKPTTLPLPTGQNESEPEQTLDLQTHAGESAISPLNSGQKRHASVSTELRVKKPKMEESDLSNASLARQLWGKRAARKEKERQLAEMKVGLLIKLINSTTLTLFVGQVR